jgi:hypothetical protein
MTGAGEGGGLVVPVSAAGGDTSEDGYQGGALE